MSSAVATDAVKTAESLFFSPGRVQWMPDEVQKCLNTTLQGMDDGELFLEYRENETLGMEDGVLRRSGFNCSSGFGLRGVRGEQTLFAHSNIFSLDALKNAASGFSVLEQGVVRYPALRGPVFSPAYAESGASCYEEGHPLAQSGFAERAALLAEIDTYSRSLDRRVLQVNVALHTEWQVVQIIRPGFLQAGLAGPMADSRPLVRLDVSVIVEQNGCRERGYAGRGGRYALAVLMQPETWQKMAQEALRQALVSLEAHSAPAGEMPVILGAGWPGILLHEAVGHGLEGDFNRKGTSVFSGKIGHRVASPGVTVVDDGTLAAQRGSLVIDDEGTPVGRTVQIEDGILKNYIHDRLNARLMGYRPTGNGRRESYAHAPIPRMTNTLMLPGSSSEEEMIRTTNKGLYAVNFGGGQVDITSGKFVFATSEAYLIEDGKITTPVRGATLIGSGADVMQKIELIGPSMQLDPGIGTCGKAGQQVPVGVGQPMLKVSGLTVGGIAS